VSVVALGFGVGGAVGFILTKSCQGVFAFKVPLHPNATEHQQVPTIDMYHSEGL